MNFCNLEIRQLEDGRFSVKIDGKEISQYITGFYLSVKAGEPPVFSMQMATDTINLSTKAVHDIPAPYKWVVESEIEKAAKDKGLPSA